MVYIPTCSVGSAGRHAAKSSTGEGQKKERIDRHLMLYYMHAQCPCFIAAAAPYKCRRDVGMGSSASASPLVFPPNPIRYCCCCYCCWRMYCSPPPLSFGTSLLPRRMRMNRNGKDLGSFFALRGLFLGRPARGGVCEARSGEEKHVQILPVFVIAAGVFAPSLFSLVPDELLRGGARAGPPAPKCAFCGYALFFFFPPRFFLLLRVYTVYTV